MGPRNLLVALAGVAAGATLAAASRGSATRSAAGASAADLRAEYDAFLAAKARHEGVLAARAAARAAGQPATVGAVDFYSPVWPLPASYDTLGNVALDPATFTLQATAVDEFLTATMQRYLPLILFHPAGASPPAGTPTLNYVLLNVSDMSVKQIQMGVDESYTLTFAADLSSATVNAATVFGALRGLESFSQMVDADKWSGLYSVGAANVADAPRYPYRGLLVDAARHWLPPKLLLTIMDGLSYAKMNTLHIVLGCDWSWTVQSQTWPNLTLATYYAEHQDHVYNISTMKALVREANLRGVRIQPFFETMGHSSMITEAYPELGWCNGKQGSGLPHPFRNETWAFFDSLWKEYRGVFADDQMNVGGDEIDISCWQNDTLIQQWMKEHNHTDLGYVVSAYYQRMMQSLTSAGFTPVWFADAFAPLNNTGVNLTDPSFGNPVFDGWDTGTPRSVAPILTAPGARAIVSSYCYLAPITIPGSFNVPGGATWETNYLCDLANGTGTGPSQENMLGGHASRWGEMTDGTNIFQFSWPAILGVAEKLWSPQNYTDPYAQGYGDRQYMIATAYRCVMVRRGIPMSPMTYAWSCPFELEFPYPALPPSTEWWPASTVPTAVHTSALAAENAALKARVAELEAQLAATSHAVAA